MKKVIVGYSEPIEYFPEEVRREFKIGEFAEEKENEEKEGEEDEEGNNQHDQAEESDEKRAGARAVDEIRTVLEKMI